jgi:hypothetical protein
VDFAGDAQLGEAWRSLVDRPGVLEAMIRAKTWVEQMDLPIQSLSTRICQGFEEDDGLYTAVLLEVSLPRDTPFAQLVDLDEAASDWVAAIPDPALRSRIIVSFRV